MVASAAIHGLLFAVWFDSASSGLNASVQEETVLEIVSIEAIPEKPAVIVTSKPVVVEHMTAKTVRQVTLKKLAEVHVLQPQTATHLPEAVITRAEIAAVDSPEPGPSLPPPEAGQAVSKKTENTPLQKEQTNSLVRNHLESFKFYPASARRRGIEGHVDVAFILTRNGVADQITVLQGSGYAMLDQAAIQTVARAQPFPVDDGAYRFRLRFKRL